jgi:hypothetical protein
MKTLKYLENQEYIKSFENGAIFDTFDTLIREEWGGAM